MGLASYYRSFVPNFSVIAAPLFNLTKKAVPFCWSVECQMAFETLKERLMSAPVLATPRDGGGYVVDVDACETSRTLTAAEKVYCTTRKEQLAIVFGLKQFRTYILGHKTVVRSDHAALQYLKRAREPVGQQARWMDFIEQFDLEICYRKVASHANADALSR